MVNSASMRMVFRGKSPTGSSRVEASQLEGGTEAACEYATRVVAFHGDGSLPEVRWELVFAQLTFKVTLDQVLSSDKEPATG